MQDCAAILLPAMTAPTGSSTAEAGTASPRPTDVALPTDADVHFAHTVAGILACKDWDWRNILGIRRNNNPNVASTYRKLNMLVRPDKRTKLGIELAGGIDRCDQALQFVQQSYKDASRWSIETSFT